MASEVGSVVATDFGPANIVSDIGIGPGANATVATFTYTTDQNFRFFTDVLFSGLCP